MTKQELVTVKAKAIEILSTPERWVGLKDNTRMVTHWGHKWEFECESNTEFFTTESIFEAVDWLYKGLKSDGGESKVEDKPEPKVEPKVIRDILEDLSEYSEILTGMSDTAWELYRENGNEIHLGESKAFGTGADLFDQMQENLEKELKEKGK